MRKMRDKRHIKPSDYAEHMLITENDTSIVASPVGCIRELMAIKTIE